MDSIPPPFNELWFQLVIGLVVGLALGSFITMLSYRLPRRLSLISPSTSFCPSCKSLLKARDLVPVASWVVYGGKCSHCGRKIGARYPLIELTTGVSCMAAFGSWGFTILLIIAVFTIIFVITSMMVLIEKK
jgi:prepilin signal peptidase PulO-like enzyme (type II secretory pathway)